MGLNGLNLALICSMLRANDLIWSYFVDSYLLANRPFPYELLYWNADVPRVPSALQSFFLKEIYQKNRLREPGGVWVLGEPVDLRSVTTPAFFLAAIEDHIAPWPSIYEGARLISGPVRFVLGGAGHVASVIPFSESERVFWTNDEIPQSAERWFQGAEQRQGIWREDWFDWVRRYLGEKTPVLATSEGGLPVLERGPGSYVKVRSFA